jgi:hypothetical protein
MGAGVMTVMVEAGNYTSFSSEGKQNSLGERERERERGEMGAREREAKGDHQKAVEREKKGLGLFDLEEG